MAIVHIIDNKTKKETHSFQFSTPEPYEFMFVKSRETKINYLMVRMSCDDNPYNCPQDRHVELFEVPYNRYSDVDLQVEK